MMLVWVIVAVLIGALGLWIVLSGPVASPSLTDLTLNVANTTLTWTLDPDGATLRDFEVRIQESGQADVVRTTTIPRLDLSQILNDGVSYTFVVTARFDDADDVRAEIVTTTRSDNNDSAAGGSNSSSSTQAGNESNSSSSTQADEQQAGETNALTPTLTLDSVSHVSDSGLTVHWTFVPNGAGNPTYELRIREGAEGFGRLTAGPVHPSTSHVVSDLKSNTSYHIYLSAIVDQDTRIEAYIHAQTAENPRIIGWHPTTTDVTLIWEPGNNGDATVTAYYVTYVQTEPPNQSFEVRSSDGVVGNLVPNTSYEVYVAKRTEWQVDVRSESVTVTTLVSPPTVISYTATANTVTLEWDPDEPHGGAQPISGVVLEMQDADVDWNTLSSGSGTVTALASNTEYTFRLGWDHNNGSPTWSDAFTVTTRTSPPVFTGYISTANTITLNWELSENNGDGGVVLEMRNAERDWDTPSRDPETGAVRPLASNTEYVFRLGWENGDGSPSWSDEFTATTRVSPPVFTGYTATENWVMLGWNRPEPGGGYKTIMDVCLDRWDGNDWVRTQSTPVENLLETTETTETTVYHFKVSALASNTTYTFRLGSEVGADDSDSAYVTWSEAFVATTRVSAPVFTGYTSTPNTITLQWDIQESGGGVETVQNVWVQKFVADGSFTTWVTQLVVAPPIASGEVTGLASSTQYTFRLGSDVGEGSPTWSEVFEATTDDAMIPAVAETGQCEYDSQSSQSFGTTVLSIRRGGPTVDECKRDCDADSRCLGFDRFQNPVDGVFWCRMKGGQLGWAQEAGVDGYAKTTCVSTSSEACYEERQNQEFARYDNLAYSPLAGTVENCKDRCNQDDQCLGFARENDRCWFKPRGVYDWEPTVEGVVGYRKQTCPPEILVPLPSINNLRLESTGDALEWDLKWDLDPDGATLERFGVVGMKDQGNVQLGPFFTNDVVYRITFPYDGVYQISVTAWFVETDVVEVGETEIFVVPADDGTTDADTGSVECWEVRLDEEFSRGNDLATVRDATVEHCKDRCTTGECLGFSFRAGEEGRGTCWLKATDANDQWVQSVGIVGYKKTSCE
jgi:hypothetical protein